MDLVHFGFDHIPKDTEIAIVLNKHEPDSYIRLDRDTNLEDVKNKYGDNRIKATVEFKKTV